MQGRLARAPFRLLPDSACMAAILHPFSTYNPANPSNQRTSCQVFLGHSPTAQVVTHARELEVAAIM